MYITYLETSQTQPQTTIPTFEELLNPNANTFSQQLFKENLKIKTIEIPQINLTPDFIRKTQTSIEIFLRNVNDILERYTNEEMSNFYRHFEIPKASGGTRPIDAPTEQLKTDLRIINEELKKARLYPHTAAYAYTTQRCHKNAIERHQRTEHTNYLHIDLHNFFGSCTIPFMQEQLTQIPFFLLLGEEKLNKLLHIATLHGVLPQGSPLSPWLTNQVMLPLDFQITKFCKEKNITYTRYADDMIFSANYKIKNIVIDYLTTLLMSTPLRINTNKTKTSTVYGRNWNLGLMVNKDNKISVGYKKKEITRAQLTNFCHNHQTFSKHDAQVLLGILQYNISIEPEYFQNLLTKYNNKFNMDILDTLKNIIRA